MEKTSSSIDTSVNVRALAVEVLIEVIENDSYTNDMLNAVLTKYQFLAKTQRSYLTRLVNGVVERLYEIDYIINSYSNTKTAKMKKQIRNILRLGVYEIYYMDSIPESATCNEAVKLVKQLGPKQLSGFVNGVLRSVARGKGQIEIKDWQTKYSMPEFIIDMYKAAYGAPKCQEILEGYFSQDMTCIRANLYLVSPEELQEELESEGVNVEPVNDVVSQELLEGTDMYDAFYISGYDYLEGLESFRQGHFYVQDLSSMMVAHTIMDYLVDGDGELTQDSILKIVDTCASPGGKSLHLASLLDDYGASYSIEARDLTDRKVSLIDDNINRNQAEAITSKVWDATVLDESLISEDQGICDVVISDVPCSGLGVIGKKPDIKYHLTPETIDSIVELQSDIIKTTFNYVAKGGLLLYSTCTINPQENSKQVSSFLEEHGDFTLMKERLFFPSQVSDGFYIAIMKRS